MYQIKGITHFYFKIIFFLLDASLKQQDVLLDAYSTMNSPFVEPRAKDQTYITHVWFYKGHVINLDLKKYNVKLKSNSSKHKWFKSVLKANK